MAYVCISPNNVRIYPPGNVRLALVIQPMVFLSETKKKARAMEKIKWSLGFRCGMAVYCQGRSGGLALWWRDGVQVKVRPWCQYFIDAEMVWEGKSYRFTGFYGEPKTELRKKILGCNSLLKGTTTFFRQCPEQQFLGHDHAFSNTLRTQQNSSLQKEYVR